jgi:dihydroflavonol-4-reductase
VKTVLVTGATGFVGSNLTAELLRMGLNVRTWSRTAPAGPGTPGPGPEIYTGDIRETGALAVAMGGCDTVFHTAAIVSFRKTLRDEQLDVNAGGTRAVVEACLRAGVRRLVHTSSVAALGFRTDGRLIDETTAFNWDPSLTYKYSKHLAELEVLSGVGRGLDAVIVNPSVIVGRGDLNVNGGQIVRDTALGKIFAYARGGLNLVAVRDVVAGELAAARKGRRGERYILGGTNLTHREALGFVADIVGTRHPMVGAPRWGVRLLALAAEKVADATGTEPLITPDLVSGLGLHNWYSTGKARAELDYRPSPLEGAVRDAYRWYRENGMIREAGIDS